ncbi:hypothetical protein DFH27DRAFT_615413 [Peziza echinospora]|nr:hypothetical protein DFH27DRAFT_615413 [Peziza echinospora]
MDSAGSLSGATEPKLAEIQCTSKKNATMIHGAEESQMPLDEPERAPELPEPGEKSHSRSSRGSKSSRRHKRDDSANTNSDSSCTSSTNKHKYSLFPPPDPVYPPNIHILLAARSVPNFRRVSEPIKSTPKTEPTIKDIVKQMSRDVEPKRDRTVSSRFQEKFKRFLSKKPSGPMNITCTEDGYCVRTPALVQVDSEINVSTAGISGSDSASKTSLVKTIHSSDIDDIRDFSVEKPMAQPKRLSYMKSLPDLQPAAYKTLHGSRDEKAEKSVQGASAVSTVDKLGHIRATQTHTHRVAMSQASRELGYAFPPRADSLLYSSKGSVVSAKTEQTTSSSPETSQTSLAYYKPSSIQGSATRIGYDGLQAYDRGYESAEYEEDTHSVFTAQGEDYLDFYTSFDCGDNSGPRSSKYTDAIDLSEISDQDFADVSGSSKGASSTICNASTYASTSTLNLQPLSKDASTSTLNLQPLSNDMLSATEKMESPSFDSAIALAEVFLSGMDSFQANIVEETEAMNMKLMQVEILKEKVRRAIDTANSQVGNLVAKRKELESNTAELLNLAHTLKSVTQFAQMIAGISTP